MIRTWDRFQSELQLKSCEKACEMHEVGACGNMAASPSHPTVHFQCSCTKHLHWEQFKCGVWPMHPLDAWGQTCAECRCFVIYCCCRHDMRRVRLAAICPHFFSHSSKPIHEFLKRISLVISCHDYCYLLSLFHPNTSPKSTLLFPFFFRSLGSLRVLEVK